MNFKKLPAVPIERVKLIEGWDGKEREEWIRRQKETTLVFPTHLNIHIIKNSISIICSEIQSKDVKSFEKSLSGFPRPTLFYKSADFHGSTFSRWADFSGATFNGRAVFLGATFNKDVAFVGATFNVEAWFSHYLLPSATDQDFNREPLLRYYITSTFRGEANFSGAIFIVEADFSGATFNKSAIFNRARFLSALIANSVKLKEYADFRKTIIRRLNFNNAESPIIVKGYFDFRNSRISEAHFQDIVFEKDVDFSDVNFDSPLTVQRFYTLPKGVEFPDSLKDKIRYEAKTKLLIFIGIMNEIEKEKLLDLSEDTQYKKAVEQLSLGSSSGASTIVFRFVTFESDAYFIRTVFSDKIAFERVNFKKNANFTDTSFISKKNGSKQKFSLSYLNFNNLLIKWSNLPDIKYWVSDHKERITSFADIKEEKYQREEPLEPLSHVLKSLETIFRNQGVLSDANNAYYHRKQTELKETWNRKDLSLSGILKYAEGIFLGIPCGYGTKIVTSQ